MHSRISLALAAVLISAPAVSAIEKASEKVSAFYGSMSHSIPIEIPGFRNLEPTLALSYSSEGRNGFVGVGWGLAGGGTVERTSAGGGTPRFDASDAYRLNGQELVPCAPGSVSPSCTSGGSHSTKIESYVKIRFDSAANTWTVWTRNGTRTVFQPTLNVPPGAYVPGGTLRWGQASTVDTYGNAVNMSWACVDGDCYPSTLSYNGYQVAFHREARPDPQTFAAASILGQTRYRLRSVIVSLGATPIRGYKLGYVTSPVTGRSLLASVQQFGKDLVHDGSGLIAGGTSLPAATFSYQNDGLAKTFQDWGAAPPPGANGWCQGTLFLSGDFNGDGRTDQLCHGLANGVPRTQVSLATSSGFAAPTTWQAGVGLGRPAIADFDNDGKSDLAEHAGWTGEVFVALSSGSDFGALTLWGNASAVGSHGAAACRVSPASFGAADFNGDGLPDVYCKRVDAPEIFVGLSTGSAFSFSVFGEFGCEVWGDRVGALDFDGDAKDDWYCIGSEDGYLLAFPSTGSEFLYPAHGSLDFCDAPNYVLGDFNGDGRTDATCMYNGAVALSTGRGWLDQGNSGTWCVGGGQFFAADADGDGASEIVCNAEGAGPNDIAVRKWRAGALGPAEAWKANWCSGNVRGGDFNGDGRSDLYCDSNGAAALAGTGGFQSDLMAQFANGLGATTQVAYTTSTSFANTNNPSPKYVVGSMTVADGRGGSATTLFWFSGGLMDRREHIFLGFRQARETLPCIDGEAACPYMDTLFRQDLASAGRPEQVVRRSGSGDLLTRTDFVYATNGSGVPRTSLLTGEWSYTYDAAGQYRRAAVTHQYDTYGNRTRSDWQGDADQGGDETFIVSSFRPNSSAYIVDRPGRIEQFDHTGTRLTSKEFVYDSQAGWTQPPVRGSVTAERNWLDRENRFVQRTMLYDTWGNLRRVTDETGRPVTTTYDYVHNIFPESVNNGANETEQAVWDPVCGQPRELRDANSQLTTVQHDALCRPTRTDAPLGAFEIRRYLDLGNPNLQRTRIETPSALGGEPETQLSEAYFDGLGRSYKTVTEAPEDGGSIQETSYNSRGAVASVTAPHFAGAPTYLTTYSYDALDRLTQTRHPDGNTVGRSYGLRSETTTDENGRPTTLRFDAYGRGVISERLHEGRALQTVSTYNALGRLVRLRDPISIQWTWSYDSLGRNYSKADPDAGTWSFQFDDAGRLKVQTDAKNQETHFDYDAAGRLATRRAYVGGQLVESVTIARSESRPGFFNWGRVTSVTGPGTTVTKADYDRLGRPVKEVRTLDGVDYVLEKRHDSAGRLRGITYPDKEAIGIPSNPIAYDAAGRLQAIAGIVNDVTYDAAGRPTQQTNANGTTVQRTYSPERGFLQAITTIATDPSNPVQDLAYDLDATGRARRVSSPFPNESWDYQHDDLYRLTGAADPQDPFGSQTFGYDDAGRITSNSRIGAYSYPPVGSARPHAPSGIAGAPLAYDANGNLTMGQGHTVAWNVSNQPSRIGQTYFTYGAFGERLKKMTIGGSTSLYPLGDDYEITDGVLTKYIRAKGLGLIAKRTGGATLWHHTDRLGSVQLLTNAAGATVQQRTYRPYGEKIADSTSHVESLGFIGERTDDETAVAYLHARYYDPAVAVFLSPDPIGPSGGVNLYGYVGGDPANGSDSSGLCDWIEIDGNWYCVSETVEVHARIPRLPFITAGLATRISHCIDGICLANSEEFENAVRERLAERRTLRQIMRELLKTEMTTANGNSWNTGGGTNNGGQNGPRGGGRRLMDLIQTAAGGGVTASGGFYEGVGGRFQGTLGRQGFSFCFEAGLGWGGELEVSGGNDIRNGPYASTKIGIERYYGLNQIGGGVALEGVYGSDGGSSTLEVNAGPFEYQYDFVSGRHNAALSRGLEDRYFSLGRLGTTGEIRMGGGVCIGGTW